MAFSTTKNIITHTAQDDHPDFYTALYKLNRFARRISIEDNKIYQEILEYNRTRTSIPTVEEAAKKLEILNGRIRRNIEKLRQCLDSK